MINIGSTMAIVKQQLGHDVGYTVGGQRMYLDIRALGVGFEWSLTNVLNPWGEISPTGKFPERREHATRRGH